MDAIVTLYTKLKKIKEMMGSSGEIFSIMEFLVSTDLHHNALILLLEPVDRIILSDTVLCSNSSRSDLAASHSVARADENNEEIHTEDS